MRRSSPRATIALLVALTALVEARAHAAPGVVYLQPLGGGRELLGDEDVALVATALARFYGFEVRTLPAVPLPARAWYAPRSRWRADVLLDELAARRPADARFVLGLTAADISTTKGRIHDWGVMGLGALDGSAAVLSSLRTFRGARSPLHGRQRLAKVAVHEIGHNFGLPHCPTRGCLMEDAGGKVVTTDREDDLCPRCRRRLADGGVTVPPLTDATRLWPRPLLEEN